MDAREQLKMVTARTCPHCGGHLDTTRYCYQSGACGRDWADVWQNRAAIRRGERTILEVNLILAGLLGV